MLITRNVVEIKNTRYPLHDNFAKQRSERVETRNSVLSIGIVLVLICLMFICAGI